MLRVTRYYRWLHSYVLLVCRQHRRPAFVRVAMLRLYARLSYIRTRCSSAINIIDLCSDALQSLAGSHCCPTFASATRLLPLPLTTFVRAPHLLSTSSSCVRTCCRASWYPHLSFIHMRCWYSVNIADLHLYVLQNLVGTHCCPTFIHAARRPPLPLATFIRAPHLPSTLLTGVRTH